MKRLAAFLALLFVAAAVTAAWSGHELPIYPSYYPQEIRIDTIDREEAGPLLLASKIQAYVGGAPGLPREPPDSISAVESLGSFVLVSINPDSPLARDDRSACTAAGLLLRTISQGAAVPDFVFHPYPVTPFHGDYLVHADLAEAAKARWLGPDDAGAPRRGPLKIAARGALAQQLVPADWLSADAGFDAAVEAVSAADLVASAALASNAWLGPPWLRTGWFAAAQLLQDGIEDPGKREAIAADLRRLEDGDYPDVVERINLERDLATLLTGGCRKVVAGYTVKREYFSAEYSAGIENVGFDAIEGFNSPIFLRTAKLKDFPWNGSLALGTPGEPRAAWNPIAGFNDEFGRLLWSALSDPALIPSPNDGAWMLNRTADVQPDPAR
jgi:hypothetical protein